MVAYTTRMPAGVPGSISRQDSLTVEAAFPDASVPPTAYGRFVKRVSGKLRPIAASDPASVVVGMIARPFPQQSTTNGFGAAAPPTDRPLDLVKRGYMSVKLDAGSAVADGQVFVRTVANGGALVGDIEATLVAAGVAAAKSGGNTGNGTISAITTTAAVKAGVYRVRFSAATVFHVQDPDGFTIGTAGATGTAFADDIGFTITAGGTPFVAGDGFDITVTLSTVPVPGAFFTGPADAAGNTEVAYRI